MSKNKGGQLAGLIKNTGIFFVGSCLSKLIVFFLLPLYTGTIPTADYGYYDLSVVYVTVLSSLLFFDVWVSAMRFIYERDDEPERLKVIHSAIRMFSLSTCVFVSLGFVAGWIFSIRYIGLIIAYGLSVNLHNFFAFIARGYKKNIDFAISGILNTAVLAGVNILLLKGLQWDFSSLYIAAIAGNLIQCVYLEAKVGVRRAIAGKYFDKDIWHSLVRFSLPLCVNSVSYWLLTYFSRIVLERVYSLDVNGIYAVGNKFGAMVSLATTCFTYAWQDVSFERSPKDDSNGRFFSYASDQYLLFLSLCTAAMLPAISAAFPFLINGDYGDAYGTLPLFLIVASVSAWSTFIGNIFYAINDTKSIFTSMVIAGLCNVALCYPLIVRFGINGANISVLISFIVNVIVRNFILKKKIGYKSNFKLIAASFAVMLAAGIVYTVNNLVLSAFFFAAVLATAFYIYRKRIAALRQRVRKIISSRQH